MRAVSSLVALLLLASLGAQAGAETTKSTSAKASATKRAAPQAKGGGPSTPTGASPVTTGAVTQPAAATSNPQTTTTGWRMSCGTGGAGDQLQCEISNAVIIASINQRFLSLAVRKDPASGRKLMVVGLPHGVLLNQPIEAGVDGKAAGSFAPLTTDQSGVYATLALTPDITKSLNAGKSIKVTFDGNTGQKFTVELPLKGFASVYDKMDAKN
jgi:invasion protein IalB